MPSPLLSPTRNSKLQLPASCDPPSPSNPPEQRVWIIFGALHPLAGAVARIALAHDDLVTVVGLAPHDTLADLDALFASPSTASHTKPKSKKKQSARPSNPAYIPVLADPRIPSTLTPVFEKTLQRWGRYDVIVTCLGEGIIGAAEEMDDFTLRSQMEEGFWGVVNVVQASLPYFRGRTRVKGREVIEEEDQEEDDEDEDSDAEAEKGEKEKKKQKEERRGGGRYLIFTGQAGGLGAPGLAAYSASMSATEGFVETLMFEGAEHGIKATIMQTGFLKPDDEGQSAKTNASESDLQPYGPFYILPHPPASPYASSTSPVHHAKRLVQWIGDRQPTSAAKAAEVVWQAAHCAFPPLRLMLGAYAIESLRERMRGLTEEIEEWRWLSFGEEGDGGGIKKKGKGRDGGKRKQGGDVDMEDDGEEEDEEDVKMED